jgi:hypothetical protein
VIDQQHHKERRHGEVNAGGVEGQQVACQSARRRAQDPIGMIEDGQIEAEGIIIL